MQAPSAGDQQPWEFFVVTDKDKNKSLSQNSSYAGCAAHSTMLVIFGAYFWCAMAHIFPSELFSMLRLSMLRQRIRGANATYIYLAHAPA